MISAFLKLFAGRSHKKYLKQTQSIVLKINELEQSYQSLSEQQLKDKTTEFKQRFAQGETLDQLLPEAFATVKNAARRLCGQKINVCDHELTWNMVHYDVQLIGGMALHQGKIAEMATGEGKTFVATLPLYLNALAGRNCQLITVNDYLAKRDSEWMGYLYNFLGLTVGCLQNGMDSEERKIAYNSDITFGTSSEFGFDYLRDNGIATRKEDQVQRDHFFCIVDEVDSVLIDEARTPLIISGPVKSEREAPFIYLKQGIEKLYKLQRNLCTELAENAKAILADNTKKPEDALELLAKVKMGMPKNSILLELMENGAYRKMLDKYELELHSELRKDEFFKLKEALYFIIEEKHHQADLSELGRNTLRPNNPDAFVLPDLPSMFIDIDADTSLTPEEKQDKKVKEEQKYQEVSEEIHCLSQLLRAYCLYEKDVEYVVQEGKVMIVDENTGRLMPGRRWSDGLHQAVEAKEDVAIQEESKTLATITIQNYFRMYDKIAGMTGTAETEASEFYDIYKLEVIPIPTNRPSIRKDLNDVIYKTRREKFAAVIRDLQEAHKNGQPVLVGTTSVEASEALHRLLCQTNITHSVLNAKQHEKEADIVARAGQKGAVTIATNMAGRGTDIKLGEGVDALGGLLVLGTERHESRRIDRQLRGRCSRQGDPGSSKFFVSLEDNLMRLFANGGTISKILDKTFEEGEELQHPLLNRSIESAQKKVEQHNYSIRKRLIKYDDVLNQQREVVYGLRNEAMHADKPFTIIEDLINEELTEQLSKVENNIDLDNLISWINVNFPISLKAEEIRDKDTEENVTLISKRIKTAYKEKVSRTDDQFKDQLERYTIVRPIDKLWQNHLTEMDELRQSIGLRSYGQKDPLNEYKKEAFMYFEEMVGQIRHEICTSLFKATIDIQQFDLLLKRLSERAKTKGPEDMQAPAENNPKPKTQEPLHIPTPFKKELPKVGRNDLCPCGSGKKFKKCCGKDSF